MRTSDFVLATLDEAAPALARLRAALKGGGDSALQHRVVASVTPATEAQSASVADFVRQRPGLPLYELAAAASLAVDEAEAQLRALARLGHVQAVAGEDGVVRWWPVEEVP